MLAACVDRASQPPYKAPTSVTDTLQSQLHALYMYDIFCKLRNDKKQCALTLKK